MKIKTIIALTFVSLMTSWAANAGIEKQKLAVSEEVLFKRMFVEKTISMPQLKVYNSDGVLLYGTDKADHALKESVLNAVSKLNKQGDNHFNKHLAGIVDKQGNAITLDNIKNKEIIIVESYVDWFEDSQKQRKELEEIFAKIQNQDILWLELDVDPKKMSGANVTVTNIE
ncbi:hypothetical protein [Thalassotalea fusca]